MLAEAQDTTGVVPAAPRTYHALAGGPLFFRGEPMTKPDAAHPPTPPRPRNRGIYLLPNLFTTAVLFAGFYAILAAASGNFENACIAVFVAGLFDGIDGRVARMTGTTSDFGVQYDSLADLVSFGMAPSLVMYHWALVGFRADGRTVTTVAKCQLDAEQGGAKYVDKEVVLDGHFVTSRVWMDNAVLMREFLKMLSSR